MQRLRNPRGSGPTLRLPSPRSSDLFLQYQPYPRSPQRSSHIPQVLRSHFRTLSIPRILAGALQRHELLRSRSSRRVSHPPSHLLRAPRLWLAVQDLTNRMLRQVCGHDAIVLRAPGAWELAGQGRPCRRPRRPRCTASGTACGRLCDHTHARSSLIRLRCRIGKLRASMG